jgi:Cu+-exporting ATPase
MMCPHCQNRVQKALSDVEGVKDVHVDLDEKKASFQVSETVTDQQLIEAVEKAGYQPVEIINRKEKAPMSKTMKVDGMMCAHCQAHVQKALSDVEGVSNVVVSLEDKQATFDVADTVSDDVLKKAVEDAGYTPVSIA